MIVNGRTVFDGPLSKVQGYFEGLGYERDAHSSIPEWLVDLTSSMSVTNNLKLTTEKTKLDLSETYASSKLKVETTQERAVVLKRMSEAPTNQQFNRPPSSWKKLGALLKYRTVAHYQDGEFLGVRFGEKIVYALVLFSLYWRIGDNTDLQSIQSTASLLFLIATLCGYSAAAYVPVLNMKRK